MFVAMAREKEHAIAASTNLRVQLRESCEAYAGSFLFLKSGVHFLPHFSITQRGGIRPLVWGKGGVVSVLYLVQVSWHNAVLWRTRLLEKCQCGKI